MGGYSASIFHEELMEHPVVDYVVRGDSGREPLLRLMRAIAEGGDVSRVPNLTYRDESGGVVSSEMSWVPRSFPPGGQLSLDDSVGAPQRPAPRGVRAFKGWWSYPVAAVLTVKGCTKACAFCGGSASRHEELLQQDRARPADPGGGRSRPRIREASFTGGPLFVIGDIRQPGKEYAAEVLERIGRSPVRNHVVLELFEPARRDFFESVAAALPNFDIELSPETHDETIRRASGKPGHFNAAVEETVAGARGGVRQVRPLLHDRARGPGRGVGDGHGRVLRQAPGGARASLNPLIGPPPRSWTPAASRASRPPPAAIASCSTRSTTM